ncbi:hypothetical protein OWV82_018743 [Melia azedarach]|uniref:Uncharacterized protein n=1 Tax=Melia azedarach TaxID=155640 RepID=A0ACC1XC20_MELAZ|nr:hypothetical protein OWV82_018743 [Melia azedarach]
MKNIKQRRRRPFRWRRSWWLWVLCFATKDLLPKLAIIVGKDISWCERVGRGGGRSGGCGCGGVTAALEAKLH